MANTGGKRNTNTFRFKHHTLTVPKITATNRIIDATTRLTDAIAGIQEAPPDKWKVPSPSAPSSLAKLHHSLYQH
jgi:hypothetical protein